MTITVFLMLLSSFSILSGLITEGIKRFVSDRANLSYNIVALIVALVVGIAGCAIYYQFNDMAFSINNIVCMFLMGLASALVSMVGFDKVKQTVEQIFENYTKR